MGLLDKFKNLFTDEEEIIEEVPEVSESVRTENKLPTFMREKIEREENEASIKAVKSEEVKREEVKVVKPEVTEAESSVNSFKFPIDYEDNDYVDVPKKKERVSVSKPVSRYKEKEAEDNKKNVAAIYGSKKEKKVSPKFKATPIISPVYGILDKNYTKEEVKVNMIEVPEVSPVKEEIPKKVDFESVRKKAYGTLSDEIRDTMCENCELYREARRLEKEAEEEELLYDIMDDEKKSDVTFGDAEENYYDYGVSYEPVHSRENNSQKIDNHNKEEALIVDYANCEEVQKIETKEQKSGVNVISTLKKSMGEGSSEGSKGSSKSLDDLELTDDLFNLIDSMYEERKD